MVEVVAGTVSNFLAFYPFLHRWRKPKTRDPWTIVGKGEERRVSRPVGGQRGSVTQTGQHLEQGRFGDANLERILSPKERLCRFVIQGDTLDDSQRLDELGCDGLGLILFVL